MELRRLPACRAEGLFNVVFPFVLKQFRVLGLDVQGDYFRGKPGSKFNSLAGDGAPAVDRDDRDWMLVEARRVHGILAAGEHLHGVVVTANKREEDNGQGNEKERDPGPF